MDCARKAVMNAVARLLLPILLLVSGCAGHREPLTPSAAPSADLAGVDWSRAERVDVTLADFSFTPDHLHFERGRPYVLHLDDQGGGHNFDAPAFFGAVALRSEGSSAEILASGGQSRAHRRQSRRYLLRAAGGGHLSAGVLASPAFDLRHDRRDRHQSRPGEANSGTRPCRWTAPPGGTAGPALGFGRVGGSSFVYFSLSALPHGGALGPVCAAGQIVRAKRGGGPLSGSGVTL